MSERPPRTGADARQRTGRKPVDRLKVSDVRPGAATSTSRASASPAPIQGFGKMWQKTYRVRLGGASVTPAE